jgi:hypothetical protein
LAFTGPYPTTFSGNTGAMVVSHTTFSGGVTNAGTIGAGGISVSSSTFLSGGIVDTGVISGGIRIDSHSRIVASSTTAVAIENTTTFGGGISNAGTISGGLHALVVSSVSAFTGDISNTGTISARTFATNGVVDVLSGGTANVAFQAVGSGGLEIADSPGNVSAFTGTVSGFGGMNHTNHKQFIDLVSVTSAPNTISLSYLPAAGSGTLFVSSGGAVVAQINMIGSYTSANFSIKADSNGNVEIVDPTVPNGGSVAPEPAQTFPRNGIDLPDIAFGAQTTLAYAKHLADTGGTLTVSDGRHAASVALLGSYIAGSFVIAADGHGGTLLTAAEQTQQPQLTHPPHG